MLGVPVGNSGHWRGEGTIAIDVKRYQVAAGRTDRPDIVGYNEAIGGSWGTLTPSIAAVLPQ